MRSFSTLIWLCGVTQANLNDRIRSYIRGPQAGQKQLALQVLPTLLPRMFLYYSDLYTPNLPIYRNLRKQRVSPRINSFFPYLSSYTFTSAKYSFFS